MDWAAARCDALEGLKKMGYSLPLFSIARSLSGRNLQRMVIVRELGLEARLIVASYLTRGLDVQSTLDARQGGAGILLISEDLEELFTFRVRSFRVPRCFMPRAEK